MVNIICINTQIYAIRQICKKYASNMQRPMIMPPMWKYGKICKNMQLYARYANMIFICKICTPHFADDVQITQFEFNDTMFISS